MSDFAERLEQGTDFLFAEHSDRLIYVGVAGVRKARADQTKVRNRGFGSRSVDSGSHRERAYRLCECYVVQTQQSIKCGFVYLHLVFSFLTMISLALYVYYKILLLYYYFLEGLIFV